MGRGPTGANRRQAESYGGDDHEVHRGDAVLVIAKERSLALALIGVQDSLRKISRTDNLLHFKPSVAHQAPSSMHSALHHNVVNCSTASSKS